MLCMRKHIHPLQRLQAEHRIHLQYIPQQALRVTRNVARFIPEPLIAATAPLVSPLRGGSRTTLEKPSRTLQYSPSSASLATNVTLATLKIAEQSVAASGSLASPEAYLGVAPGSHDKYKITEEELTTPFHGIRYIESSAGPLHLGNSSGILIVQTALKSANLHLNGGTFKGIIIVDEMDKLNENADVIGAVVAISDFAGAGKFGNGNSTVKYSSYVVNNLGKFITDGDKSVKELSWKELKR